MNKDLQPTYKFEFFNKTKYEQDIQMKNLSLLFKVLAVLISLACVLRPMADVSQFEYELSKHVNQQESISSTSGPSIKDSPVNINEKNWQTAQYNLLKLRTLNSTQVDKEVLTTLADYSKQHFTNKPYSNEFALLTTNYLASIQTSSSQENISIKNLNERWEAPLVSHFTKKQDQFKQEYTLHNKNINDVKEKGSYLLKGLKETELKQRLINSFEKM